MLANGGTSSAATTGCGQDRADRLGNRHLDCPADGASLEHVLASLAFADHDPNGTVSAVSNYTALPASGHTARWATWDGAGDEVTDFRWENEGWTISGQVARERVQYVVRLTASWQVRQFLLFRDLEEPDLWLATDGTARWGEMNGAHRAELDGCYDVGLPVHAPHPFVADPTTPARTSATALSSRWWPSTSRRSTFAR